jgi:hypothetical protein
MGVVLYRRKEAIMDLFDIIAHAVVHVVKKILLED